MIYKTFKQVRKGDVIISNSGSTKIVRSVFTARDGYSTIYFKEQGKITNHFDHEKRVMVQSEVNRQDKK